MADKQLMMELGSLGLSWCFQPAETLWNGLASRPSLGTLTLSIFWQELLGNNHSSTVLHKLYMLTQTQLSWVKAHCCRHVLPVCMSLLFILLYAKNTSKSPSLVSCCEAWKHAQTVGPSVRCDQMLTCIWLISRARCPGRELKISALKAVCTCPRRWLRGSGVISFVPWMPRLWGTTEQKQKWEILIAQS